MAVTDRNEHLRGLILDRAYDVAFVIRTDGVVSWRRESTQQPVGVDDRSIEGQFVMDRLHPEDLPLARQVLDHLADHPGARTAVTVRVRHAEEPDRWQRNELVGVGLTDDPLVDGVLVVSRVTDLGEIDLADQAAAEATFRAAFDHSHAGIALVALDGRFQRLNPAWATITGYDEHHLLGRTFAEITHPADLAADEAYVRELLGGDRDSYRMEKRYLHRAGGIVWVDLRVAVVRDRFGAPVHFVSTIIDISERKGIEDTLRADNESLSYRATHDHLTGLPNRHLLEEHLRVAVLRAPRSTGTTCILMADLDRFKAVNDGHGHAAGDAVLVEVAHRLRGVCREGDIVARWGGDEFIVVAETVGYPATAIRLAERLIAAVGRPIEVEDASATVGMSIGIARVEAGDTPAQAVARADVAAYGVKQSGGGYSFGEDGPDATGGPVIATERPDSPLG